MSTVISQQRRRCLRDLSSIAAMALCAPAPTRAHANFGPVEPRLALPEVQVIAMDGASTALKSVLAGHVTALQLMYTGCSATCPIQGAMFARLQQQLALARCPVRLVSVSIDPRGDDLKAMRAWLLKHGAQPAMWTGILPQEAGVDRLQEVLKGRSQGADRHTPQVYVIDRQARLMYRSEDLPSADALFRLLVALNDRA